MQRPEGIALRTTNAGDRVALRGVRVRARLSGMSQRTTIEQTFVNAEDRAIEAVYTFPLPESAAVCGFEVVTGDRVLTGRVEEAERAIDQYEDAVSQGHGAFVMEEDRPDVFTVRVGNLKPRQAATIRLTYVAPLEKADRTIRVAFPTAVAPRYVTSVAGDPLETMIDGDAVNPPHVLHVPYGLSMEVEIDLGRDVTGVASPSHAVRVERREGHRAVVTLAGEVTAMDRDVVLELKLAREHQPTVQASTGPAGASYLAVTFLPEFDDAALTDPPATETVFVLDCSGSMQGDSIRQAVAALELCLRCLSPGDTFNVCRFGSSYDLLASEPLAYTQATLDRALAFVRQDADLGGTELHAPLQAILKVKPRPGTIRQIILLTDGQVSNEAEVIELARKHRATSRIFSFGIGSSCSAYLVKGIARATGGAAEFITDGERIDDKVLRTFSRLASPMVSDVSIDWDGAEVQTLAELPPVFDGDVMAVYGRAPGRLPRRVTLRCETPAGRQEWTLPVPPPVDDAGVIATTWARRMIQSIEEVNGLHVLRQHNAKPTREQQTLVDLSKEFGLLSCLTTFVAVEHRSVEDRNEGRPALRRVPVALAKGWGDIALAGGASGVLFGAAGMACPAPATGATNGSWDVVAECIDTDDTAFSVDLDTLRSPTAPPRAKRKRGATTAYDGGRQKPSLVRRLRKALGADGTPPLGASRPPVPQPAQAEVTSWTGAADELTQTLARQAADGSFSAPPAVRPDEGDCARWCRAVEAALPPLAAGASRESVVETVLVLLLLAAQFANREPLWKRARAKAVRSFLAPALTMTAAEVEVWLSELRGKL